MTRLRGFQDLLGQPAAAATMIENCARQLMARYAVREIRIPLLERVELYQRSSGETSDVVTKQMYAFTDRDEGQTVLALRPEGTPGVVRAYVEAGLDKRDPEQRFFYGGPMFRRERPQKGRYRQFYQFGVEIFGRADPACDAELITMVDDLCRELKLAVDFEINSLGCQECRPAFRAALLAYGREHWAHLCHDCHERLEHNPLRLLDCKIDVELAAAAPKSLDFLCPQCRHHFDLVQQLLAAAGVAYKVNPRIVRGLDYYVRTTFEVYCQALGAQNAIAAGGRYDGLVATLGGASVPASGFAIGVDRLALALELVAPGSARRVALIALGEQAVVRAAELARQLRQYPFEVELLSPERSLKAQLKRANHLGSRYAVILGEDELARGRAQLRDLERSLQHEVALEDLAQTLCAQRREDAI